MSAATLQPWRYSTNTLTLSPFHFFSPHPNFCFFISISSSHFNSLSPDDLYILSSSPRSNSITADMQFTIVALLSLVAVAFAGPVALPERLDG
jgi:hypothetical protein